MQCLWQNTFFFFFPSLNASCLSALKSVCNHLGVSVECWQVDSLWAWGLHWLCNPFSRHIHQQRSCPGVWIQIYTQPNSNHQKQQTIFWIDISQTFITLSNEMFRQVFICAVLHLIPSEHDCVQVLLFLKMNREKYCKAINRMNLQ